MKNAFLDPYCYPNTNVLRNLADIRDPRLLELTEAALTVSQTLVVMGSKASSHDLKRLLSTHRMLFGNLYPFAGQLRAHTGQMTKTRSTGKTVIYCDSTFVPEQLDVQFRSLVAKKYLVGFDQQKFAERAAYFYGEIDAVHSFREGNSRTLRLFFYGLAETAGFVMDWVKLAAEEELRQQLYAARDRAVMQGNSAPLALLFSSILRPL